jgi:hypothetical protein
VEDINENGLGFVATGAEEDSSVTLDKTWQEIYDAFSSGISVVITVEGDDEVPVVAAVVAAYVSDGDYCLKDGNGDVWSAADADEYPVLS